MTDRLFFVFSSDPLTMNAYVKARKKEKAGKDYFVFVTTNNITGPLEQPHYKIYHPIELLGDMHTEFSFRNSYAWQEILPSTSLSEENGGGSRSLEDAFSFHKGLNANILWAVKYTAFFHVRSLIIDTVFAAIDRFPADEYIFFGQDKWMRDLEGIVSQCVKLSSPGVEIMNFYEIAPSTIVPRYMLHIEKNQKWRQTKLEAKESGRQIVLDTRERSRQRARLNAVLARPNSQRQSKIVLDPIMPASDMLVNIFYETELEFFRKFFEENKIPGGFLISQSDKNLTKGFSQAVMKLKQSHKQITTTDLDGLLMIGAELDCVLPLPIIKKINPIYARDITSFQGVHDIKFIKKFVTIYSKYVIKVLELALADMPSTKARDDVVQCRERLFVQIATYIEG